MPLDTFRNDDHCPSKPTLLRYLRGETAALVSGNIDRHFESCQACLDLAMTLERDDFEQQVGEAHAAPQQELDDDERALIQRLRWTNTECIVAPNRKPIESDPVPEVEGYEVSRQIGRGGMGVVYRAKDIELDRTLAMKVLRSKESREELTASRIRARFFNEAKVTAQLDHPGIVPVHRLSRNEDDCAYFTMKLVDGNELGEVFDLAKSESDGWTLSRAIGVMVNVCQAVAFAHSRDVIHRDLKPENVMVGRFGEVYVMDWGLAKVLDKQRDQEHDAVRDPTRDREHDKAHSDEEREQEPGARRREYSTNQTGRDSDLLDSDLLTLDGSVIGTPAYMSPEQAKGMTAEVGRASDIYALGAILYRLLAGHAPFVESDTKMDSRTVLAMVLQGPPRPIDKADPTASAELVSICEKAMSRIPGERYEDCLALAEDLQAWREGRVVRAHAQGPVVRLRKWVQRNTALSVAIATAVSLLLLGSGLSLRQAIRATRAESLAARRAEQLGHDLYAANIARAVSFAQQDRFIEANELLLNCSEEHRGWEWRYLRYATDNVLWQTTSDVHRIWALDLAPDGKRLIAAHAQCEPMKRGVLTMMEATTGKVLWRNALAHGDEANCARFSHDGARIVSCGDDGRVRVWKSTDGSSLLDLGENPTGTSLICAMFSNDDRLIFGGGKRADGRVVMHQWDAESGKHLGSYLAHSGEADLKIRDVEMDADGFVWSIATDGSVECWNPQQNERRFSLNRSSSPTSIVLSPDSRQLAVATRDGQVELIDTATGSSIRQLGEQTRVVRCVDFSPDGTLLASCGDDFHVTLASTETGWNEIQLVGHKSIVRTIVFSADGQRLYSADELGHVICWDLTHSKARLRVGDELQLHERDAEVVAISDDGKRFVSGGWDGQVYLWDADELKPIRRFGGHGLPVRAIAINQNQQCATLDHSGLLRIWDAAHDNVDWQVKAHAPNVPLSSESKSQPRALSFFPDGDRLVTAGERGEVVIWDINQRREHSRSKLHDRYVTAVDVSPDGKLVALAAIELGTVVVADDNLNSLYEHTSESGSTHRVRFSPDGRMLASCHGNHIDILDAQTGKLIRKLLLDEVFEFAWSSMSNRVIAGRSDGSLVVMNVHTGSVCHEVPGIDAEVATIDLDASGERMLVGYTKPTDRHLPGRWQTPAWLYLNLSNVGQPARQQNAVALEVVTHASRLTRVDGVSLKSEVRSYIQADDSIGSSVKHDALSLLDTVAPNSTGTWSDFRETFPHLSADRKQRLLKWTVGKATDCPNTVETQLWLGESDLLLGNTDEATEAFVEAAKLDRRATRAYLYEALLTFRSKHAKTAATWAELLTRVFPSERQSWSEAVATTYSRDPDRAAKYLQQLRKRWEQTTSTVHASILTDMRISDSVWGVFVAEPTAGWDSPMSDPWQFGPTFAPFGSLNSSARTVTASPACWLRRSFPRPPGDCSQFVFRVCLQGKAKIYLNTVLAAELSSDDATEYVQFACSSNAAQSIGFQNIIAVELRANDGGSDYFFDLSMLSELVVE